MAQARPVARNEVPTEKIHVLTVQPLPVAAEGALRPKIGRRPDFMEKPHVEFIPQPDPHMQTKKARRRLEKTDIAKLFALAMILTFAIGYGLRQQPSTSREQLASKQESLNNLAPSAQMESYQVEGQRYTPSSNGDVASQIVPLPRPQNESPVEQARRRELLSILKHN